MASLIVVVDSEHFYVGIQDGSLSVMSVPLQYIPHCGWWLTRELNKIDDEINMICDGVEEIEVDGLFTSFIVDNDGLSLVTKSSGIPILESLLKPEWYTLSLQLWKALIINVKGAAYEFPGAVYYLANILSEAGFSIFHISTFESEIFLVQEKDIDRVSIILKDAISPNKVNEFFDRKNSDASKMTYDLNDLKQAAAAASYLYEEEHSSYIEHDDQVNLDMSWISPLNNNPIVQPLAQHREDFYLNILPNHVILARLVNSSGSASSVLKTLANLMLYDARFCELERKCSGVEKPGGESSAVDDQSNSSNSNSSSPQRLFMWGLWRYCDGTESELTILLEEEDLGRFPMGSLAISPQRWRVAKLAGRPIAFDETGVVSSMSKIETNVPSLNISTAITNCTLVPEEVLHSTVETLSRVLQCPVKGL